MKEKNIYKKTGSTLRTKVFPEAGFSDRTLEAIKIIQKKKIAKPILIGDESALVLRDKKLAEFQIIDPSTFQASGELVKKLYEKRKEKGLTLEDAEKLVLNPYYFGTLMVECGYADGMVAGAETATANVVRPALQIIKPKKRGGLVSSCFLMYGKNEFLGKKSILLADCGIVQNPTGEQLYQIAMQSVETYKTLDLGDPKVAFLSYSTKGSAEDEQLNKIREAFKKLKKTGICCDGELQFDAAMVGKVAQQKCPESELNGDANILIFPDLNSGNICYKAMQYFGGVKAIGPIIQGLKKPINDLSRGCSVDDIVTMTAVTVLQINKEDKNENISD